ncbi:MAG: methyltransferase family protein [Acidobacteriota bacterium]
MKLNVITLAVVATGWIVFMVFALRFPWTPLRIAGFAIFAPCFVLFVMARIQLGRSFSIKAKATSLVTTGVYARIRNPIYVFGAGMLAGAIVYSGRLWLLLGLLLLIPMQIRRSRKEEQVLTEQFGEAYLEYKRRTWF